MKKSCPDRDVDECSEKVEAVLSEYNCKIEYDDDAQQCVIVDQDNYSFCNV